VSFNGTANINLPGVNTAGNQNTTGSAATLTTARTIGGVSFNGSANINLPGVNTAGNQNTTGTAANITGTAAVANGGTGRTTLTANNVLLGNGTTAVNFVAPGTSGNVLTSNGTTWTSGAAPGLPSGSVIYVAMNTAPTGFLKANGAAVSRTTYAALFAAIGTTFGAGNGSTTFNVPDIRGEFMRGWDDGRGIDSGRAFGSFQATRVNNVSTVITSTGFTDGRIPINDDGSDSSPAYSGATSGGTRSLSFAKKGGDTYPRNRALLACIKF
jgi:phage-related tail fiber protein